MAVVGLASSAFATGYGTNLIVNPGAETVTGAASNGAWGGTVATPSSWTLNGVLAGTYYSGLSPVNGSYVFTGGQQNTSTATQDIAIGDIASAVATGNVGYSFAALLGGYVAQPDSASLALQFMSGGNPISSVTLGPVTNGDRANATGLLARSTSGLLPLGTDTNVTNWNDGYGDQFNLSLTAPPVVPEPASLGLLGLGAVALLRRRR
jgi:hypothetical protein